jgi:peptide chain release factor subunit 3
MIAEQYGKPDVGGQVAGLGEDDEPSLDSKYDKAFGPKLQKIAELKDKAGPGKTEAEKEEQKVMRIYKDRNVDIGGDLVEVDTTREPCSMVFIGHVDAGKSTICGNLMYMMGVVDVRTIEKYKQEARDKGRDSWWLAYVMDVSDDEKAKGKTVEVGRAQFDTPSKKYTIFDAPGHKNYVPNMIMGAACADVGGLVISARKGEYEAGFEKDGQTREHAQLAKALGVQKLIIVVNKMDDCKWSKTRWDEIQTGLKPFLNATGYRDEDLLWVPISGLSGDNIKERTDKCNWYKGPSLIELLDEVKLEPRFPNGPLRIPILDKMKDKDPIIHGKVENGTVKLGDKLALMPYGHPAQVLGLLDGKGQAVKYATPGENVQIRLNIADEEGVKRGDVLCLRDQMMPVTTLFEAEVDVLDLLDYKPILSKGYNCIMHIHTYNDEIVVQEIIKSEERNDKGEVTIKQKPSFTRS